MSDLVAAIERVEALVEEAVRTDQLTPERLSALSAELDQAVTALLERVEREIPAPGASPHGERLRDLGRRIGEAAEVARVVRARVAARLAAKNPAKPAHSRYPTDAARARVVDFKA